MARMMGATSSGVVTGYFGPCIFLDNQRAFDAVFGKAPTILSAQPLKNAATVRDEIEDFIEHCKFDIFMASCRNYYVGVGTKESDTQATHAACKSICGLRMEEKFNVRMLCITQTYYSANSRSLPRFFRTMRRSGLLSSVLFFFSHQNEE